MYRYIYIIYTMPLNPQAAQAHPTLRDYLERAKESCSHALQHIYCNTKIFYLLTVTSFLQIAKWLQVALQRRHQSRQDHNM